jgi:hypothetical protein
MSERENCVQDGHTETLRLLVIELKADVNVASFNGKTAVIMAAQVLLLIGVHKHVVVLTSTFCIRGDDKGLNISCNFAIETKNI